MIIIAEITSYKASTFDLFTMNLQTFSTNIIYAAVFYQKEKNMKKNQQKNHT